MFTITITITQDENNNVTVKTVEPKTEQPKKAVKCSRKTATKSKATKKFQHLPEPMDVDFEASDNEDDSVPFETL